MSKSKFFKRRNDIDIYPNLLTKVEETSRCLFINLSAWVTPKEYCDNLSQPTNEIKRLNKVIRMELWNTLSQQDFFYDKIYLTDLTFPPALLPTNQRVFMNLELVVYRRDISNARPDIELVTNITNPIVHILDNNTYFNFNRNKAF